MPRSAPPTADHSLDFALLQQSVSRQPGRNRRAFWWLLGLLALLVGSVVTLLLYLNNFEAEEAARRRAADAQWLEQSVQFHFRRLEDDLLALARQASSPAPQALGQQMPQGGLLALASGVLLDQGWLVAAQSARAATPVRWATDAAANPANVQAQQTMQATTQGLRRAAFAGVMLRADGNPTDVVWLAVPFFDRGQFVGNYVAAGRCSVRLRHWYRAGFRKTTGCVWWPMTRLPATAVTVWR